MKRAILLGMLIAITVLSLSSCQGKVDWQAEVAKGASDIISSTVVCAAVDFSLPNLTRCLLDSTWRYIIGRVLPKDQPSKMEVIDYVEGFTTTLKSGLTKMSSSRNLPGAEPQVQISAEQLKVKFEEYARRKLEQ